MSHDHESSNGLGSSLPTPSTQLAEMALQEHGGEPERNPEHDRGHEQRRSRALLHLPVTPPTADTAAPEVMCLELQDGEVFQGYSFGSPRSVAGELVFQTGMVGYPESLTDPSYRGQILVMTFPLVGNYGVPSMDVHDELLRDLTAYFEAPEVHVAGLVTASYAGEDYSHFLAESSLGAWLRRKGVPAMYGVDTRAITKLIREEGSMLGRLLLQRKGERIESMGQPRASEHDVEGLRDLWRNQFHQVGWHDPNRCNLVKEGKGPPTGDLCRRDILLV